MTIKFRSACTDFSQVLKNKYFFKTSFMFDIGLVIREEDSVAVLTPIIDAMPIKIPSDIECELCILGLIYSRIHFSFPKSISIVVAFFFLTL